MVGTPGYFRRAPPLYSGARPSRRHARHGHPATASRRGVRPDERARPRRAPRAGHGAAADPRGPARRAPRLPARHHRRRDRRALPRPGDGPPHRHRGHRAAAPGRAGAVGLAARPGGGADRRRTRAAHPRTWPSRPTASTASRGAARSTRSRCSACTAAPTWAAGTPRRTTSTCTRSSSARRRCTPTGYAMGVVRDGDVGTGDPDRDTAVLAFFGDGASSQGDVNEAFVWAGAGNLPVVFFCQNNQWAISEPVERAEPRPAVPARGRFRLPRRPRRRQRRARLSRRHPQGTR